MQDIYFTLRKIIKGEMYQDTNTLKKFSHDASIFELIPEIVISPEDVNDVKTIVKFVSENKKIFPNLYITPRSAGTDMSGGSLGESIVLSFTEHFNKISEVKDGEVEVEPGVYYRDLERKTAEKNLIFPSYPVSKDICAIGGMIGNNCGGEKSFSYGKTDKYISSIEMVMADGNVYQFSKLSDEELRNKLSLSGFEGEIYRNIYRLINDNYEIINKSRPSVSKNSSGYNLWDVYNKDEKTFDLTRLFCGSQGTLGIMTSVTLKLVPAKNKKRMVVIYLQEKDIERLAAIINLVLPFKPESFETYDDNTLRLAVKYYAEIGRKMGLGRIGSFVRFLPEFLMVYFSGTPKLVLQAEFAGEDAGELEAKAAGLVREIKALGIAAKEVKDRVSEQKYWLIRRESFSLLKNKILDKHAAPFIDDIIVEPKYLGEFLPKFNQIMAKYPSFISTVAGHIGDGNFHVIPLVDIEKSEERSMISKISKEVFDLVLMYHGSTSGEHNDGIIRTPYLKQSFGEEMFNLFEETKKIFDPLNIFNTGKKIGITQEFLESHIRKVWSQ